MTERKSYGSNTGTPIQIQYPRASAQTQQRQRQTDSQQYDYADDNPNAWKVEKTPNSAVRLDRSPRQPTRSEENKGDAGAQV